jgi:hypothetical protein
MVEFYYTGAKGKGGRKFVWGYINVNNINQSDIGTKNNLILLKSAELYAIVQVLSQAKDKEVVIISKNIEIVNDYNFNLDRWIKYKQNITDQTLWRRIYEMKTDKVFMIQSSDLQLPGFIALDKLIDGDSSYAKQNKQDILLTSVSLYEQGPRSIYLDSSNSLSAKSWSPGQMNSIVQLQTGSINNKILQYLNNNNIAYQTKKIPNGINITTDKLTGYINIYTNNSILATEQMNDLVKCIK